MPSEQCTLPSCKSSLQGNRHPALPMPVPWSCVLGCDFMTHKFLLLLNDIMAEECRVFLLFHHFLTLQFEEQKIKLNPFFLKSRLAGCMQLSWDKRSKLFLSMTCPTLCLASSPSVEDYDLWPLNLKLQLSFCCWQHRRMYDHLHRNVLLLSTCKETCHTKHGSGWQTTWRHAWMQTWTWGVPFSMTFVPSVMSHEWDGTTQPEEHIPPHTKDSPEKEPSPGTLVFDSLGQRVDFSFVVIYSELQLNTF